MKSSKSGRFAFYAKRFSRSKASIRLRVLGPMDALREAGIDALRFRRSERYDVIIISKAFGKGAANAIRAAKQTGCGLIFDICDNRFASTRVKGSASRESRMCEFLTQADLITVPTEKMGHLLTSCVAGIEGRIRIVPDMLENMCADSGPRPTLMDRVHLARLRAFHARHPGALHCVWFGNNMAGVSGVGLLDSAMAHLRSFSASHPVTLTIINDQPMTYRRAAAGWGIPSIFVPWSLTGFSAALRAHRVAVIPVAHNDYTLGKSINRPATALMAGLGVIADAIPSYEELRPFIVLDDWQGGLMRYARGWEGEQPMLAQARAHLDLHYGRDRIAERWVEVLAEIGQDRRTKSGA
ncbi:hypothetical protein J3E64_002799 [Sphingobium sp. OAS761]|uniref:hypothetical protein n=1 Tax=Sphingobium sp. OAS761 TaxID=2817901 RepID=UPI00209D488E|nr:hypothetical protein [Sphingobium sp. OAS761]MCP1471102.1 hypothetical protein [Sphingobium sp. OAS761]